MKLDQMQQAQDLYFTTGLNKSEIAEQTGVSRRTIHNWSLAFDWERQKKAVQHMPVSLTENCYHIMGHLTEEILSVDREYEPVTTSETNNLYKLTQVIGKLNAHTTASESMQVLLQFADAVAEQDAEFADKLLPFMEQFIAAKAKAGRSRQGRADRNSSGRIPRRDLDVQLREEELDRSYAQQPESTQSPDVGAVKPQPVTTAATPAPAAGGTQAVSNKPRTIADELRAKELAKPKPDIRKLLRGTSPTGPSKVLRQPVAA